MFTLTVEQDPASESTLEETFSALDRLLLPKTRALWESWVASGRLAVEDGEGGPHWQFNDQEKPTDDGVGEQSD